MPRIHSFGPRSHVPGHDASLALPDARFLNLCLLFLSLNSALRSFSLRYSHVLARFDRVLQG